MTEMLKLARNLELPVDAVTQTFAFLGRRGSGKTYGATKLAELMLDAGAQIVALDPVGVWYGLRMNAAQTGPSPYAIPVLGGRHGDIPLEASAGKLIADLVVDRGTSIVLDVSMFESDADKARFAEAFAARFFFRKKERPSAVHVFVEECQEFIPQNTQRGEEKMLHAFNRMMKLGRNFGIGMSLISQRPQEVNKKTLNMSECLLAFQMTGPQERKTIEGWAVDRGVDEDAESLSERLPFLEVGTAHVWSPQWLQVAQDSHILKKRTADVSSTPKVGDAPVEAKPLGAIDLEQLQQSMAATIEKAKAEDPALLRAELARVRRELTLAQRNAQTPAAAKADPDAIAKAEQRARDSTHRDLRNLLAKTVIVAAHAQQRTNTALDKLVVESGEVSAALALLSRTLSDVKSAPTLPSSPRPAVPTAVTAGQSGGPITRPVLGASTPSLPPRTARADREISRRVADDSLTPSKQKVLDAIAALERLRIAPARRIQVALFAGYTENGHFNNMLGEMRTAGLIEYPEGGTVALTGAGHAVAHADESPFTSLAALHDFWIRKVGTSRAKLLRPLIDAYPGLLTTAELAEQAGYTENGHFNNMKGELRTMGLVEYPRPGYAGAADVLFPPALV